MTNEEIKGQCETYYAVIKFAEEGLIVLRESCNHSVTFEGNYSWRVGVIQKATICTYCNTPIIIH